MTPEQALDLLRGTVDMTEFTRHQCAKALEDELVRVRGVNQRNKERFEKMKTDLASAQRDSGIYKSWYETLLKKVKDLELKIMALGPSNDFQSMFNDALRKHR